MDKRLWPAIGILGSICLFVLSAAKYPGGGREAGAKIIGYDWTQHFISTLFAAVALNGQPNPARYFAIPAMLIFCVSIAVVFQCISRKAPSLAMGKSIQIAGIGSMVYAFLAVATPIHDLFVSIAVLFFLVAVLVCLQMLNATSQRGLVLAGALCLVSFGASAVMYYGNVLFDWLPIAQKLTFVVFTSWLWAVHWARSTPQAINNA